MSFKMATQVDPISKGELFEKINSKDPVQIVNVLKPEYYSLGFIQGSKRIPEDEIEARFKELDRNREVVTYCASYDCHASRRAAEKLTARGYKVRAYEGGIKEWKESGLPME